MTNFLLSNLRRHASNAEFRRSKRFSIEQNFNINRAKWWSNKAKSKKQLFRTLQPSRYHFLHINQWNKTSLKFDNNLRSAGFFTMIYTILYCTCLSRYFSESMSIAISYLPKVLIPEIEEYHIWIPWRSSFTFSPPMGWYSWMYIASKVSHVQISIVDHIPNRVLSISVSKESNFAFRVFFDFDN